MNPGTPAERPGWSVKKIPSPDKIRYNARKGSRMVSFASRCITAARRIRIKQACAAILLLPAALWPILSPGCSGKVEIGGGGGGGGELNLSSVSFTPSSVVAGGNQSFSVSFSFAAPGGNLDGGRFNFLYEGTPYATVLPDTLSGQTAGSFSLILPSIPLSARIGTVFIAAWIQDRAGNTSNRVTVAVMQRL